MAISYDNTYDNAVAAIRRLEQEKKELRATIDRLRDDTQAYRDTISRLEKELEVSYRSSTVSW